MKQILCTKCGGNMRIDIGKSVRIMLDDSGRLETIDDGNDYDIIGEAFCEDCGNEMSREEIEK